MVETCVIIIIVEIFSENMEQAIQQIAQNVERQLDLELEK